MQQISRYEIENELDRGALSATFRARDSAGAVVALRTVHVAALADETDRKELRRVLHQNAKGIKQLEHRNIVAVREVIEERDFVHLVSDFVEAPRLSEIFKTGQPLAEPIAIDWLRQVATALDEGHRRGIIHGALWPNNIFVENAPSRLRVADFVVAMLVAKYSPYSDPSEDAHRFLAPEQIQEAEVTGKADQFALGALGYLFLTGAKPFDAEHLPTLYYRICKEEPRPAKELVPALGDGVSEALSRALAKAPGDRFSSCAEFIKALASPSVAPAAVLENAAGPVAETTAAGPPDQATESPAFAALPPLPPRSGERAFLLPEKSHAGRKLALAFILGILIGAGVWVNRYWKASAPVPVQVADPSHAPTSPPPQAAAKPEPRGDAQQGATNLPASDEPPTAEQKNDAVPDRPVEGPPPASQSIPMKVPPKRVERAADSDNSRDSTGATEVRLVSDPVGARIVVDDDGSTACTAPCSIKLAAGRHTLMATVAGSVVAHRIFTVPADQEVTVVLSRSQGTLLVSSSPAGAQVLVDGQDRGRTPASVRLPAGPHRLVVILNGDLKAEQTVVVEGDQIVSRTIRW